MDNTACLELALEGERLCKAGDCRAGVAFFEAAIQAGTDDLKTLSAVYSQLGNAYFYLGEYVKAMQYHKHDLTLARSMSDRLGEAKASGNLGNTLKVMGRFEEAAMCCQRHLDISRELGDKIGEGRALYNLGNVYHAQGKHIGRSGQQDPGEFPEEVRICLQKAVDFYEQNLHLMVELGDRAAQGRACGNLGNTHYLLGNFTQAITYHQERLKIAREYGDKSAERRAHSNLGNAHVFLGEFESAAEHYKKTLVLAQELSDRAVEAQACYSLGNTFTLLRDYNTAIDYHVRHLKIALELQDKVGEGRACWSLGNAHAALANDEKALQYAKKHLEISKEIGDKSGQATAEMNVSDLNRRLGLEGKESQSLSQDKKNKGRRSSMDQLDLLKLKFKESRAPPLRSSSVTTDTDYNGVGEKKSHELMKQFSLGFVANETDESCGDGSIKNVLEEMERDNFFDALSRFQSKRLDDQRCPLGENKENHFQNNCATGETSAGTSAGDEAPERRPSDDSENGGKVKEDLFDLIAGMQSRRLDEQRASLPYLPGLSPHVSSTHDFIKRLSVTSGTGENFPDENFFDMLMRCQGSRLDDQRSSLPSVRAPTVPDEDFFSLILKLQGGRLDDQRSQMPDGAKEKAKSKFYLKSMKKS